MAPVPIVMCGKFADHAANFSKMMLPEYEVVHHFQSVSEATSTLPSVMQGKQIPPVSGVGTNTGAVPVAMFVGGGFSDAELDEMRQIPEGKTILWLGTDPSRRSEVQQIGLEKAMEGIVARAKAKLGELVGREDVKGTLVRY